MKKYAKVVIVPCKLDTKGKIIADHTQRAPYGYHHVLGVYSDSSAWVLATIDLSVPAEKLNEVVKSIVGELPIEVEPEYYAKR